MKKVLILANNDVGLYNFRFELLEELIAKGYQVYLSLPYGDNVKKMIDIGCYFINTDIDRRGTNLITDIKLLWKYNKIISQIKPDVVLTYTIKPNIYGGIISTLRKVPYLTNITGMGSAMNNDGLLQKVIISMHKIALLNAKCVFFQNSYNREFFYTKRIIKGDSRLLPGSGVNINKYNLALYPNKEEAIKFLFIGRVMREKGVIELLEAAKEIKIQYPNVEFHIVGPYERGYETIMNQYIEDNIVFYHGTQSNVYEYLKQCHAIVLPSYHEGLANVLLEAAATGRPVIASNIPGCRETFVHGETGLGFEVKNKDSLTRTLKEFINYPHTVKANMGINSRMKVELEFDRSIVVNAYIEEIEKII